MLAGRSEEFTRNKFRTIVDERSEKQHEFSYAGGIASFVGDLNTTKQAIHAPPILVQGKVDETWEKWIIPGVIPFRKDVEQDTPPV